MESGEVLDEVDSSREGLSPEEIRKRFERYGPNKLPEEKKRGPLKRFFVQFHNMLIYVLLAASVVTALLEHWIDTWVILAVVLVNAIIGFVQEGKAEKAMEGIRAMLSPMATVRRGGERRQIPAEELVPGDIVLLESGDRVPADLRLLDVKNLKIEESALTGESVAVEKSTGSVDEDSVPGDRICMGFAGTMVTYGRAAGVVTETGSRTEIGKISTLMEEVEQLTTPLLRKIEHFGKGLSVTIVLFATLLFLFGYFLRGYTADEMFLAVISLTVAAIPEGLPAIITITLAIGVQRMARRNSIIRRLPAVETLGSVTVICSDKTGTLTRNEMTVRTILTSDRSVKVTGTGYKPEGEFILGGDRPVNPKEDPDLREALLCGTLCSEADVYQHEDGSWTLDGDPTEGALVTMGLKGEVRRSDFPDRIDYIPFESEHRFMASLNRLNDGRSVVYVKGAPEVILDRCSYQLKNGEKVDFEESSWKERMDETARKGERLLALAVKEAGDREKVSMDDIEGLTLIGITGMIDPPRDEAIESIRACYDAGIRVIMITGDHAGTAAAIAEQLGMRSRHEVITGNRLEKASDEELKELIKEHSVFARTSPLHKLQLVMALQEENHVVAMTGDGVNDAPALRRADIGVAMGIKGTEVSKGASEMVLADDNFASIEAAVEEGRTVYDNIRKAILFILPTNGAEAFVIMAAIMLGIVLPITPVQILWVNMVTAVTLALALAFELPEEEIMKRKPRASDAPILGGYFLMRILYVSVLIGGAALGVYLWMKQVGMDLEQARTTAVNILVAGQAFYLFNCRYTMHSVVSKAGILGNKVVLIALGALFILQMIFVYTPWFNLWFGTTPIDLADWSFVIAAGLLVFLVVEIEKWVTRSITESV